MPRPASEAMLDLFREDYARSGRRIVGGTMFTKRDDGEDRLDIMWVWISEEPCSTSGKSTAGGGSCH